MKHYLRELKLKAVRLFGEQRLKQAEIAELHRALPLLTRRIQDNEG